jgi:threonine dehydratase
MKSWRKGIEVWGVEAANSPTFSTWFRTGTPGEVAIEDSIAEGLAGYVEPETMTWPMIRKHVDRMTTATEEELIEAMRWMVTKHRMIIEPSGGAAIAAVIREQENLRGRRVAAVVSGGNIAWRRFLNLVGTEWP